MNELFSGPAAVPATAQARARLLARIHADASFDGAEQATLMFLCDRQRVLLIRKRRGHGAGLVNAPGGKLEPGETPLACAVRETREEVGVEVDPGAVRELGELRFLDVDGSRIRGWAFRADRFHGTPATTPEAIPFWAPMAAIPYASMWPGDRFWLPWVLANRGFRASLLCDGAEVLETRVTPAGPD